MAVKAGGRRLEVLWVRSVFTSRVLKRLYKRVGIERSSCPVPDVPSLGFSFVRLGVFYLWRRGFGDKTSRPEWPTGTGPPSPSRKTQTFAQTSSLDCPLWLQRRPWSAWTVCSSLARTFCWPGSTGFFFFLMRYGGCCGLSKKHLSTERDINLVHKLHLRKERKGKERLKRWRKFEKQLSWACFSPVVITIIMMIMINLPALVDFVKKMILKPQPKFRVCCVSVAQHSTTRPRTKNESELLLREERGDCASAKMPDEKPQLWLTDGSSR